MIDLHHGDCLDIMPTLEADSVDTVICDPPYALTNRVADVQCCHDCGRVMGGRDGNGSVKTCPKCGGDNIGSRRAYVGGGFMGKDWDNGLVAFSVEVWREALRVAKPGAMLLAFGGTRTFHRLACAIEDAGWELRDTVMWVYGSGFPKSHDISKAIDKVNGEVGRLLRFTRWMRGTGLTAKEINEATGTFMGSHYLTSKTQPAIPTAELWAKLRPLCDEVVDIPAWVDELVERIEAEREVVGQDTKARSTNGKSALPTVGGDLVYETWDITAPATPAAETWHGWGTALKPAWEPIIVAMKPLDGTFAQNALQHGVAGLWIDGGRVPSTTDNYQGRVNGSGAYVSNTNGGRNADKDRSHNAEHLRRILGKLSRRVECELFPDRQFPNDETYVHHAALSLNFQGDCLIYHRFCDELSRLVLEDGLLPQTLQDDVLKCIHPCEHWDDLGPEHKHIPAYPSIDRLSSWDAFRACMSSIFSLAYKLYPIHKYTTLNTKTQGRWPANLIHDGSDEVLAGFPDSASPKPYTRTANRVGGLFGIGDGDGGTYGDTGSAARFFYCAKASRSERNAGLEGMEARAGGSTVKGYTADVARGVDRNRPTQNHHPTVKPIALMRYLARLTKTPTGGVVLDPFMGSGSTGIGAVMEGRDFIGIEQDADYIEIARRRIEHWQAEAEREAAQLELQFD